MKYSSTKCEFLVVLTLKWKATNLIVLVQRRFALLCSLAIITIRFECNVGDSKEAW